MGKKKAVYGFILSRRAWVTGGTGRLNGTRGNNLTGNFGWY
jgi:hypothetical protein